MEYSNRLLVISSFWIVIVFALPFWWKTTEVYRAQLPFADIDQWASRQRTAHATWVKPLSSCSSHSLVAFVFPQNSPFMSPTPHPHRPLALTWPCSSHPYKTPFPCNIPITLETTASVFLYPLWRYHGIPFLVQRIRPVHSPFVEQANPDSMRTMKYSSRYQMTFSLMNGDPSNLNVDWDIRGAIESKSCLSLRDFGISYCLISPHIPFCLQTRPGYLSPFIAEISAVSNFTIDSQIQHYASLAVKPHYREREREPSYHYLDPESLPHFINSAEWNLGEC
ncbi:phosphatidylinositol-glycan biosynthesis class S protein-domain-containing protein [Jimgerdemannia flammicorona]|uniref:Phosphatidylinositol-glycan biosynthesis class S protein-domain-containing protein n=1 Tax=Jimgerdemannia flammicorona TaxID=994334 RepID=A0A433QZT4_9FUNG|nr:phosphatidylinositol-glycan biosynthesis class S protein-domain-containing protein [Jimgerdemannia flammicorona]